MLTQYSHIQACKAFSDGQVAELRRGLAQKAFGESMAVVTVGSLGRREASEQSDVDYFIVYADGSLLDGVLEEVAEVIGTIGLRGPSLTGVFAKAVSINEFVEVIGGSGESNEGLTRRMLFLLESDWLYGQEIYRGLFRSIIERYIGQKITQHQLARFFLNDLIRYYRTICVDFEYKTANGGKSWGDRNLKLMFSRKLLYFSGVLAAAETAQSACEFKRSELIRLLALTPVERVHDVCGVDAVRVLARYDVFLSWMADSAKREILKSTNDDRERHSEDFRGMKNAAHHFSWELESLLHRRYAPTHSIYQALIF